MWNMGDCSNFGSKIRGGELDEYIKVQGLLFTIFQ